MNYTPTHFAVTRESLPFALPLLVAALLATYFGWFGWALFLLILFAYVLYFFRNPERESPPGAAVVISPADGKIVATGLVPSDAFEGGQALRIAIFMSVFNVHMNWAPLSGIVQRAEHICGSFINAMENKSCEENERKILALRTDAGFPVIVKLVAGLIARRIVCPLEQGDRIERGDKIGLIRFGSRVEVLLPPNCVLEVSNGMHVRGGETVIARIVEVGDRQQ